MPTKGDLGTYFLPVIPSFEGGDRAVNDGMGKILGKLGDLGKRSGASLGKGLGDGLKSAEAEVNRAIEAYGKLRDRAADALGKVRVEEEKLAKARTGGKQDQIVAAEERLAKARRDSTRVNKEAAASYESVLDAQKRIGEHSSRLGGALGGLSSKMAGLVPGGLGSDLAGMAGSMGSVGSMGGPMAAGLALGVTSFAAFGAAAVAVGKQLYDVGTQFDDLRDKLQISTGASGDQLESLVGTVEKLGTTNVASSFSDIGGVVAEVTRNLHLSGPALEEVTSRIANLNRMTGESVNMKDLGKAFRGFGVDAKDQAAALDSLYGASTKSGMSVNDMLGSVTKAGPALRQFGLSFGQSAALVNTFDEAGVDTDKTIASLNKAFAYLTSQGLPAQQGLQMVITEIQRLRDAGRETDAAGLANKVFGAKGGVNFFELIKSGAVDLQTLSTSLQSTGIDINQTAQDTSDWSERWQILKNEGLKALDPLGTAVFNVVNDKLGALADWVSTHKDQIIDFFVGFGQAAITGAEVVVKGLGYIAGGIGDLLEPIGDVMGMMDKFQAWQADIRGDKETAAELRKQADEWFGLGENLQKFRDTATGLDFGGARDKLKELGEQAKTASTSSSTASDALGAVTTAAKGVPGPLEPVNSGLSKLSENAKTGASNLQELVTQLGSASGAMSMFGGADGAPGLALNPGGLFGAGGNGGPIRGTGQPYGMPIGTNTGGYGGPGQNMFPQWVRDLGAQFGVQPSTYPGHQESGGQNHGIDWVGTVDAMDRFAKALAASKPDGLKQVVWQNPQTGERTGLTPDGRVVKVGGEYYRDDWAGHQNHVHTSFFGAVSVGSGGFGAGGNGAALAAPAPASAAPAPDLGTTASPNAVVVDLGSAPALVLPSQMAGAAGGPAADLAASQAAADAAAALGQNPVNAYGPQYEPGYGTPGTQDGVQGYFRPDPKQVREAVERAAAASARITDSDAAIAKAVRDADQRATDAHNRMLEADRAVTEAMAKVNALDATASDDERKAAEEQVRQARQTAATARREADDAQTDGADTIRKARTDAQTARQEARDAASDAQDAQKGSFSPAKKKSKDGKGSGDNQFGELGNIAGSFLKETFGLDGSIFPDISNMASIKSLGAVLGAFKDPIQAAIDGGPSTSGYGTLSDPFGGQVDTGGGGSTSGLPFGMIPGVSSLLPPTGPNEPGAPSIHGAGGGQPPGPVNASTNITINNPQGDEQSIANRTRQTLLRTPRLNTYTPPGVGQ